MIKLLWQIYCTYIKGSFEPYIKLYIKIPGVLSKYISQLHQQKRKNIGREAKEAFATAQLQLHAQFHSKKEEA